MHNGQQMRQAVTSKISLGFDHPIYDVPFIMLTEEHYELWQAYYDNSEGKRRRGEDLNIENLRIAQLKWTCKGSVYPARKSWKQFYGHKGRDFIDYQ